jgi:hypothetical protein
MIRYTLLVWLALLIALTTAAAPVAAQETPLLRPAVVKEWYLTPEPELSTRRQAAILIVIRKANAPESTIVTSRVHLWPPSARNLGLRPAVDSLFPSGDGVRLDALSPGTHRLWVGSIAYNPAHFLVTLTVGCRTRVEVYLGLQPNCTTGQCSSPSRVVVTTCLRAA